MHRRDQAATFQAGAAFLRPGGRIHDLLGLVSIRYLALLGAVDEALAGCGDQVDSDVVEVVDVAYGCD